MILALTAHCILLASTILLLFFINKCSIKKHIFVLQPSANDTSAQWYVSWQYLRAESIDFSGRRKITFYFCFMMKNVWLLWFHWLSSFESLHYFLEKYIFWWAVQVLRRILMVHTLNGWSSFSQPASLHSLSDSLGLHPFWLFTSGTFPTFAQMLGMLNVATWVTSGINRFFKDANNTKVTVPKLLHVKRVISGTFPTSFSY